MRVFLCTVATLVLAAAFLAGSANAQQSKQESEVTIRTGVQEVVLDLAVRDKKGRPVRNLRPEDVEILEDGVKQQIRSIRFVSGKESVQQQTGVQATAAKSFAKANPLPAMNLICLVLHDMDTDPNRRKFVVDALQQFLKGPLPPDTWIGAFHLGTKLTAAHPFTKNPSELLPLASNVFAGPGIDFSLAANAVLTASPNMASIEVAFNGNPAAGGSVSVNQRITGGELSKRAITGAQVGTGEGESRRRGDMVSQRRSFGGISAMQTLDQLDEILEMFGTLPGRKTVLLLSSGMITPGEPDWLQKIVDKAVAAGITFYALDVNGLTENSNSLASSNQLQHAAGLSASQRGANASVGEMAERSRQGDYIHDAVRTTDTQATLREISEATGGFLIANTNDLKKPYQRIIEDMETHFEAIYRPASDKYDGRLRSIEVKLAKPDLTVNSRTGYYAIPAVAGTADLAPHEMLGLGALSLKSRPHAFDFGSAALRFRPAPGGNQYAVAVEVPAAALTATSIAATKKSRVHVSCLALIKDASGNVVDKYSKDATYDVPDENLAAMRNSGISFTHPVTLTPGRYTVETAVIDHEAQKASTSITAFESTEAKGVGISSIMLVQRLEPVKGAADPADPFQIQADATQARLVVPELAPILNPSAKPATYFVVYPDKTIADKPKIQVEFLVGGQVLAKQMAELPPPDATGAIPMVVGAAMKPGDCELRITAIQGDSTSVQSVKYKIAGS